MNLYNLSLNGDNEKLKARIRWYENKLNSKKLQFKFKDGLSVDKSIWTIRNGKIIIKLI